MDLEKISITIKDDDVKKISNRCNELLEVQRVVEDLENQLTIHNNKLKNLQERIIPELMQQAGVSKIKLAVNMPAFYSVSDWSEWFTATAPACHLTPGASPLTWARHGSSATLI